MANGKMNAHTPGLNGWHLLDEHLRAVARATRTFADRFECGDLGYRLGIAHDLAKADPVFQMYLQACSSGKVSKKCPHAAPSAAAAKDLLGSAVLPVIGHHAGMPDLCDAKTKLDGADSGSVGHARELLAQVAPGLEGLPELPEWARASNLSSEMMLRMAFSCLIDADYLDTENHFHPHLKIHRGKFFSIKNYLGLLESHLSTFVERKGGVNEVRDEIQKACFMTATKPRGAFRLTVPTGGGKTLSGLGFALSHAEHHGMDRVIVAIPYTSIIDQTAGVYQSVFGEENVLEHHSALELDEEEEQDDRALRRRLNIQNWDCPLIVTTTVQLFESLLHNRPAQARKLHNIVNSVIVLDEVQALPPKCLKPILDVLNELVSNYRCSVVFCTATQLDYSVVDDRLLKDATEIVPEYRRHFEILKRVKYEVINEPWSVARIARELGNEEQVLAVFNTRKDALAVGRAVDKAESVLHLSTLLCGHHRKQVIDLVKERIKKKEAVRLISTQVVEAGVDLDFPVVYRDVGPLDRIIQVAGRCNREGKLDFGRCVIFPLESGGSPQGVYAEAIRETKKLLKEYGERLEDPQALSEFSRGVFAYTDLGEDIQKMRAEMRYRSVARSFNLIENDTVPLIVSSYQGADVMREIETWNDQPKGWFKRVGAYTVNVFQSTCNSLQKQGLVYEHESGAWIYSGGYDQVFGLTGDHADPVDLEI